MSAIIVLCRNYPQIVIFLALAIGYFIGKIKIRNFKIGSTAGVLIAALFLGQMQINIPALVQTIGFALFIFCIGYQVGPHFFGAIKKEGFKYVLLALLVAVVGLVTALVLGKFFGFDSGMTAGMLGGAMTQSATIGTAQGAIQHLAIGAVQKSILTSDVAVAYAITYIFGTVGLIIFFKFLPRIMRIDLKAEAKKLEQEMSGDTMLASPALFSWYKQLSLRAYLVNNKDVLKKTVQELEALFPGRVAIEKIKRNNQVIAFDRKTVIKNRDIVVLIGTRDRVLQASELLGPEIADNGMADITGEVLDICVLNKKVVGKTLGELSRQHGHGCFLRKISRQGHEIPITRNTVVRKCDVLRITGTQKDVEKVVESLGYPERPTAMTDLIMVGIGCVLGTLLGLIAIPVAGIPITLGVGGGVLVSGLLFGWLRAVHPTFGQIPMGAQWIFTDFGLNLFIACVGLTAGPKALHALQTTGISLFFAGVIVTLLPMILGLLFGKFILRLNPVLLLGALTGAGTSTATLNAVKEETESSAPALGYTVPYAFGNVLLTVWGTVIISVMHVMH